MPSFHPTTARIGEERFRLLVESIRDYAIFMLDPDGTVVTWNAGAERIKGYRSEEIIGRHFSVFYPQERIDEGFPQYELEVAAREGRFEDEGWRLRKDGTRFWANVVITALYESDGRLAGYGKVTRDLTERRAQEETLRRSEERFRLLVDGVKDYAIFMLDTRGYVMSWNGGAERIKGYRTEDILGRHFSIFYPRERIETGFPEHELEVAAREGRFEDEGWRLRKDGTRFWANVVITALRDERGQLYGYAKVTRDMTERRRIEELEAAGRRMFEFLAMLSHELRNPLAPISNAVYMLQLKPIDDPDIKWVREVLDRQVSQLTRLVDDLLEVSRVTSGNIRLKREPVDLGTILSGAIESSRPTIESRRHTLSVDLPGRPVMVDGDVTRLTQIVVNLLNNAAKYTPEGGRVDLTLACTHTRAIIRVRDNGVGIPQDFLPKIFDLFAQGERTLDRAEGGLGIGLTLVRRLAEMHGGHVEARSAGAARGSEFIVTFPLIEGAPEAISDVSEEGTTVSSPPPPLRVLVVDDNVDAATSMMLFMRMWGYDVRVATDGPTALGAYDSYRPDVVLLDIGLPGLDGYEVAARLRERDDPKPATLVAVTGYGQEEDQRRAREAGFTHHYVKPIEPARLRELLERLAG